MLLTCAVVPVAAIFLGVSAALAQQPETAPAASASSALTNPPVFQGLMVDAKGKTVGRVYFDSMGNGYDGFMYVIRQIAGAWVALPITDPASGFATVTGALVYWYQSVDCTGQAYMLFNPNSNMPPSAPVFSPPSVALISTIPPATAPSIYFAGTPSKVTIQSFRYPGNPCALQSTSGGDFTGYMGPIQSVPVSSLGLTLPFSIK